MNRLLEIGFQLAGHWVLDGDGIRVELSRHSTQRNVLYAFVCDGEVKYVGKTVQTLAARMAGYRTPGRTQSTNINNRRRIRETLSAGAAVDILVLPDNGLLHYGVFHVNLAAALEDDVIRVPDPPWNGGGTAGARAIPEISDARSPAVVAASSFPFILQPTYYRNGFFNVGVASQHHLGADGETIELFLGAAEHPALGAINRRANSNGTPRVMGGTALRGWFQASASVNSTILVEVLSPTAIRLSIPEHSAGENPEG